MHLVERWSGSVFTFTGDTKGARVAATELADEIARERANGRPKAIPVIRLSSCEYGSQTRPIFVVIEWLDGLPKGYVPVEIKPALPAADQAPPPKRELPGDNDPF